MNKIFIYISTIVILLITQTAFAAKKIILAADYWCPYNCDPSDEREGVLVEIARQAFLKKEIVVEYKMAPWSKSKDMLDSGEIDGILGATEGEIENAIFPKVEQATSIVSAFTLNDNTWIYDGPSSISSRVLGVTEGYRYSSDVKAFIYSSYIARPQNFIFSTETNSVEDNITKLLNGEIFVFIEDENVVNYYLENNNINNIRNAGRVIQKPSKLYIAFSAKNPDSEEYAKIISEATIDMKSKGKLRRLYKKYSMKITD